MNATLILSCSVRRECTSYIPTNPLLPIIVPQQLSHVVVGYFTVWLMRLFPLLIHRKP